MGFCDKTVFHLMSNNMYINRMSRESLGLVVKYPSVYLLSVNRHNTLSFLGINKIFLIRLNVFLLSFLRNHIIFIGKLLLQIYFPMHFFNISVLQKNLIYNLIKVHLKFSENRRIYRLELVHK